MFVLLAAATIAIGIGFAAAGAWLVLPFAGLEALALGLAFFAVARRAPGGVWFQASSDRGKDNDG